MKHLICGHGASFGHILQTEQLDVSAAAAGGVKRAAVLMKNRPANSQDAKARAASSLFVSGLCVFLNTAFVAAGDDARGSPPGAQRVQEKTRLRPGDIGGLAGGGL